MSRSNFEKIMRKSWFFRNFSVTFFNFFFKKYFFSKNFRNFRKYFFCDRILIILFLLCSYVSLLSIPALFITNRARTEKLRGEKLWTVEKTRKKHGFGGFWNEIFPESNSPQLPEHLSRISDGIFTQTRYVDASTELGESIGSG